MFPNLYLENLCTLAFKTLQVSWGGPVDSLGMAGFVEDVTPFVRFARLPGSPPQDLHGFFIFAQVSPPITASC